MYRLHNLFCYHRDGCQPARCRDTLRVGLKTQHGRVDTGPYSATIFKIILSVLLYLPMISMALPSDDKQTLHIVADSSTFNYKNGTNTYEGNVKVDQGSTHLTADRVITHNSNKHTIQKAVAYGLQKLAEYTTLPKNGDRIVHAKAKTITFYPLLSLVTLEGNVFITQGENSFQGAFIIYNMKDQVVSAPASKNGRATIVIEPEQINS